MNALDCPHCGAGPTTPHAGHCPRDALHSTFAVSTPAQAHRVRTDLAALQLTNQLRRHAADRLANSADLQLLAALDRWAAGELV